MKKLLLLLFLSLYGVTFPQSNTGVINGKLLDKETQNPVAGASIQIIGTYLSTESDANGEFSFTGLKLETYQLKVSVLNYSPIIKSDLVVYASKPLDVVIQLIPMNITLETINVDANYFSKSSDVNISTMNLDFEEIRRAPGATEDISRMLQTAPGVSIGNDQRNDIIVRGGSPSENLLLIDGIEIPNINHFNTQGSTSGAIGFINVKFIQEANIFTGGFPSRFGDKSSGVVDIRFREGSRKKFYSDINLNVGGFGGIFEGPLFSEKGSYIVSVRRSYLELLKGAIQLSAVPNFWDINLKLNYDLSPSDKLSLIGFGSIDRIDFDGDKTDDLDDPYGKAFSHQNNYVAGFNYTKIFKKGYLQTTQSNSISDYDIVSYGQRQDTVQFNDKATEREHTLKTELNYQANKIFNLNFTVGGKLANVKNNVFAKQDTTYAGYIRPDLIFDNTVSTYKLFGSFNLTSKFLNDNLVVNAGFRVDYFDYINLKTYFSPRVGASYKLTPLTTINASYGIFYQAPAYLWLASNPINKNLNDIRSEHFILGFEQLLSPDFKFTVEAYEKRYKDYPVATENPTFILIDGGSDFGPNLVGPAVSAGKGYVRGIDFSLHKKLTGNGFYGMLNYSYSYSNFTALVGGEKPGAYDPTNQITLIAGYQVADEWLVGFKIKYAGGKPYTPLDINLSTQFNRGIYATNDFNSARYPDYIRVDLRIDKKVNFKKASLVGYIEFQNLLNRKNVNSYFWNETKNAQGTVYNWAFLPVGGLSLQF
jgi:outer membrane cobalamin receptor